MKTLSKILLCSNVANEVLENLCGVQKIAHDLF